MRKFILKLFLYGLISAPFYYIHEILMYIVYFGLIIADITKSILKKKRENRIEKNTDIYLQNEIKLQNEKLKEYYNKNNEEKEQIYE